ncbi:MAG: hypothetical protein JRH01_18985 [Deltaproteobacteria bacterium]|nr:hypothetical protein [Deltaproteobacteria bacterium]
MNVKLARTLVFAASLLTAQLPIAAAAQMLVLDKDAEAEAEPDGFVLPWHQRLLGRAPVWRWIPDALQRTPVPGPEDHGRRLRRDRHLPERQPELLLRRRPRR